MIDLKQYGYIEADTPSIGLIPGRVTEQQRDQYTVITEQGEVTAILKSAFYHNAVTREDFPCVGDFVFLQYNEYGASRIAKLLPRRSKFSRADYSGHAAGYVKTILEQVVATNFDYVFIVSSLNLDFNVSRIMRYLTQARQSGGQPVVILTKADLVPDFSTALAEVQKTAPDVPGHAISSHTGRGLDGLSKYLQSGRNLFTKCRFNDCRHLTEPGCAVLAALANGSLAPEH
ncbi:GTPase RsgA [Margalitia sp. FSL K6-0131]|uniref:GTPase RsgA n=1 Tax=Margalitia sp. FSL K6-0131 TaxID=2954604 RepID=UPI0030F98160